MSLRVPLAVRLVTSKADRHIENALADLNLRSVVPGGFASATFSLQSPLRLQPDELAYYSKVYVYDGRNGNTVWEGRLEDPGRNAGPSGEVYGLSAVGPSAYFLDRTEPIIYVDQSTDGWVRRANTNAHIITDQVRDANDVPGLTITVPRGTVNGTGDHGAWQYRRIYDAGQALARIFVAYDMGVTDSDWRLLVVARTGPLGAADQAAAIGFTTTGSTSGTVVVTDWTNGRDVAEFFCNRITSSKTVADDVTFVLMNHITVRGRLKDASGNDITTGYTLNTILASEVVKDLLGRRLTMLDGATANIATTAFPIEQLAYPDGATAQQIFDDLAALEPAYYPAAWESTANGKPRFEYVAWPTTVRYECDATDGIDSPGSAAELFNQVRVRWLDANGVTSTVLRTSTVAALDARGLTRTAMLDLSDAAGTLTNAQTAGDNFLAEHNTPPNAGSLTISRPILDLVTGRYVQPWEIRPGNLFRVRGIQPHADSLNATDRDGVTVFRGTAAGYSAESNAATIELDSYPFTVARMLATLAKGPTRGPVRRR